MDTSRIREQQGSIPATILVAIIMAGIVVALFAIVQSGVRSSAVDRDANQSIQVADAGVQEALVQLRGVQPDETPDCDPADGTANTPEEGSCVGVIGEDTAFEWRYVQTAPFAYDVTSVGAYRNHGSAVNVQIIRPLRFQFAITVRDQFTYNGAGGGLATPIGVGTFNNATVNGQPAIDSIAGITPLHAPKTDPPDLDHYSISPESLATDEVQEGPDLDEDLARAACFDDDGNKLEADPDNGFFVQDDIPSTLTRGHTYCVRGGTVSYDVVVNENPDGYDDPESPPPPAYVYIVGDEPGSPAGGLTVGGGPPGGGPPGGGPPGGGGGGDVNWDTEPNAGKLFVAIAKGAGNFTISGNRRMAAGLWAPWSSCTWNGTPEYRGAVVCDTVTLNGNFGYDDAVNDSSEGEVMARFWSQEAVPGWGRDVGPQS